MMNKSVYTLGLLVMLLLAGCRGEATVVDPDSSPPPAEDSPVTGEATATRPLAQGTTILAEGQLVAVNPVLPLAFEVSGRLLTLAVAPGDVLRPGDLIATLDDGTLQDNVAGAELQLAQAENSLAQAELSLDTLLAWQPDELAVSLAEANLAAAEANLVAAETRDAAAGNSLTAARIRIDQAEQSVGDAQEAYDTAHDPGRDWELNDPFRADFLKAEREATTRGLALAQDNLAVARAEYNLALANLSNDNAISAGASVISAQQALAQVQTGPKAADISAVRLQVEQAELAVQQSRQALNQAQAALSKARLLAPGDATVLSVEAVPGAMIGAGSPVVTLLDTGRLQFHTSNVSERDLDQIRPGQPVTVILKSFPSEPLAGSVAGISPQASGLVGDAAVFPVWIELAEADLALRPGMTGRAEIHDQ